MIKKKYTGRPEPLKKGIFHLELLSLVFTARASAAEKIEELETKYGIETITETGEGMERMCNLSDLIEKEAMEKGLRQGMQEGKLDMLVSLVKDGLVTAVEAAKRAGLTQEEFQKKLIQ